MTITIGQQIRYRPSGREGHIVANFPDRHRVRLRLQPTAELPAVEVDEVAYHDLEAVEMAAPTPASAPQVLDETQEEATEESPRRGRRLWPERENG